MWHEFDTGDSRVLGLRYKGTLSDVDLRGIRDALAERLVRDGAIRLVLHLDAFDGFASWSGLLRELAHEREIASGLGRVAVVADSGLVRWSAEFLPAVSDLDLRGFDSGELPQAVAWALAD